MKAWFFSVVMILMFTVPTSGQQTQENKDFLDAVKKMEAEIKRLLSSEQKERKADMDSLRNEIASLRNGKRSPTESLPDKLANAINQEEAVRRTTELVETLKTGNLRFVTGKYSRKDLTKQRQELTKGQQPYAIVLTCSDSRVPPELLFDESLGRLFVIRVAGNVVDSVALGSIEYAAEHLHTKLLVILGHTECGAVKATASGGEVSPNISSIIWRLRRSVERARVEEPNAERLVNRAVSENVAQQIEASESQSGVIKELVEKGELGIVGAVYDLSSGKVVFSLSSAGH